MFLTPDERQRIARVGAGQARRNILYNHNVVINELDLDDMRQEASIMLWRKNDGSNKPFAYWLAIARNVALTYFTRRIAPGMKGLVYRGMLNVVIEQATTAEIITYELRDPLTATQEAQLFDWLMATRSVSRRGKRSAEIIKRDVLILGMLTQDRDNMQISQALGIACDAVFQARRRLCVRLGTILQQQKPTHAALG